MINQKVLSEIKVTELDKNKYYIFTYDEQKMEELESSGYKAIKDIIEVIRANFPDLLFIIGPDYKLNIKEVLDLKQLKNLKEILDIQIKEMEKNETI